MRWEHLSRSLIKFNVEKVIIVVLSALSVALSLSLSVCLFVFHMHIILSLSPSTYTFLFLSLLISRSPPLSLLHTPISHHTHVHTAGFQWTNVNNNFDNVFAALLTLFEVHQYAQDTRTHTHTHTLSVTQNVHTRSHTHSVLSETHAQLFYMAAPTPPTHIYNTHRSPL